MLVLTFTVSFFLGKGLASFTPTTQLWLELECFSFTQLPQAKGPLPKADRSKSFPRKDHFYFVDFDILFVFVEEAVEL